MSDQSNLSSLFAASGLDDDAVHTLNVTVTDLGQAIMAGLGNVSIDTVENMGGTEVLLVRLLIDDSYSIQTAKDPNDPRETVDHSPLIIEGHNMILDALQGSKSAGVVLVSCTYLNGQTLYPFVPLEQAVHMDPSNYHANGGTPLYDMMAVALSGVQAKTSEFEQGGVASRSVTYVVTDGADMHSRTHRQPDSIRPLISGMVGSERHIIGGMGIDDNRGTDFAAIFGDMGIPPAWILTPKNTPSELRAAFNVVSQSAVRASQSAGSFSQAALGGFGS